MTESFDEVMNIGPTKDITVGIKDGMKYLLDNKKNRNIVCAYKSDGIRVISSGDENEILMVDIEYIGDNETFSQDFSFEIKEYYEAQERSERDILLDEDLIGEKLHRKKELEDACEKAMREGSIYTGEYEDKAIKRTKFYLDDIRFSDQEILETFESVREDIR